MASAMQLIEIGRGFGLLSGAVRAMTLAGLASGALVSTANAYNQVDVIATNAAGAAAGNGTFASYSRVALSDAGSVGFLAALTGTAGGSTDNAGVYLWRLDGGVAQLARKGSVVAGTGATYGSFDSWGFAINTAGQLAFKGVLAGAGINTSNDSALFQYNGLATSLMAREASVLSGTGTTMGELNLMGVADDGDVLFSSQPTGSEASVFRRNSSGGNVLESKPSDVIDGQTVLQYESYAMAPDGTWLLHGHTQNNLTSDIIFTKDVSLRLIAKAGQLVPGSSDVLNSFSDTRINVHGDAVFAADTAATLGGASKGTGLFVSDGSTARTIVREGQASADGNGYYSDLGSPSNINAAGQFAFNSKIAGGGSSTSGLFFYNGSTVKKVLRAGDAVEDGNGLFSDQTWVREVTDGGQMLIQALLTNTSGGAADDNAIYIGDAEQMLLVTREGATVGRSSVSALGNSQQMDLNSHGQVAYSATLANGAQSIYLFTPELHWRRNVSGSWDNNSNWTIGLRPEDMHDVVIDTATSLVVTGPAMDEAVKSLQVGGGAGIATLALKGGAIKTVDGVTVKNTGVLTGDGRVEGDVLNQGKVIANNLGITGDLSNQGVIQGNGRISARVLNQVDGSIRVNQGEQMEIAGAASSNAGRIEVKAGELQFDSQLTNVAGTGLITGRDATLRFQGGLLNQGSLALAFGTNDVSGDIENTGKIVLSGGGDAVFYDDVHSNGTIHVGAGSDAVFFGRVSGAGAYTGSGTVFFEGDLAPGNSPALVKMDGSMVLGDGTYTVFEIGGLARGSEYDAFDIGGLASLGGRMEVAMLNGFTGEAGSVLDLIIADEILGGFSDVSYPTLAGLGWQLSLVKDFDGSRDALRLSMVSASEVPVPASAWLFGSAMVGLASIGRRQRG